MILVERTSVLRRAQDFQCIFVIIAGNKEQHGAAPSNDEYRDVHVPYPSTAVDGGKR